VDSKYLFAKHCKHLKRIGALRSGRGLRRVYRGALGSSDLKIVETFRTGIDGLYHFENIPKGEYTIHVQDPNVKEPNWGPAAYRRVSVADDNAVIELEPTVIDYK
jgi:hypothetical protein